MSGLTFRPYASADQDRCIEIFVSNTPQFFGPDELKDFRKFLETLPCPYYAVTKDEEIVACGGYGIDNKKRTVVLAWGMARTDLHKRGLGTFLLVERLKQIYKDFGDTIVETDTSQHSRGFFERFGFEAGAFTPDYYAPGLHRIDMQLVLNEKHYTTLLQPAIE